MSTLLRLRVVFFLQMLLGTVWATVSLFDTTTTNFVFGVVAAVIAMVGICVVEVIDQ